MAKQPDYGMFTRKGNAAVHVAVRRAMRDFRALEKLYPEIADTEARDAIASAIWHGIITGKP